MLYTKTIVAVVLFSAGSVALSVIPATSIHFDAALASETTAVSETTETKVSVADTPLEEPSDEEAETQAPEEQSEVPKAALPDTETSRDAFSVPFYSQFTDITAAEWKKVGCGIASLAMLVEFYKPGTVSVDTLLEEGIAAHAYLSNAGWTYAGLISVSKKYGLGGEAYDLGGRSTETAFGALKDALKDGPVMASVHYTFDPKNPIPHLVVVNGVEGDTLYYNDPAEKSGGGSISVEQFQKAWKKRYIEIRPAT